MMKWDGGGRTVNWVTGPKCDLCGERPSGGIAKDSDWCGTCLVMEFGRVLASYYDSVCHADRGDHCRVSHSLGHYEMASGWILKVATSGMSHDAPVCAIPPRLKGFE